MAKDDSEEIIDLTSGFNDDNYVFEQAKEGFIFWNKKENRQVDKPSAYANFAPLPDCAWKLATKLEDYGSKEMIWTEVRNFIVDHVFLPDERLYDVLTAWVFASWIPEKWNVIPYLSIKGPINSGKTRLLETLEAISYRGIFSANMTSSALFRLCELFRPCIFLDETEIYTKDAYADVLHLVNAGYRRGQKAWRVEHARDGIMVVKGYDVFGFKAFSGTKELTAAVYSRSIIIDMVRNVDSVNFSVNQRRALAIRNRLLKWRFESLSKQLLSDEIDENDDSSGVYPPSIDEIAELKDGRLLELFFSLLLVSNSGTENIVDYAKNMFEDRRNEEQTSLQSQVLEALLKCEPENGRILVKTVAEKLNEGLEQNERFKTHFVTKLLSSLGLKKIHMKKGVGVVWDNKMIGYRARQFRLGTYEEGYIPPVESSKSSKSSPQEQVERIAIGFDVSHIKTLYRLTTDFGNERCVYCGKIAKAEWQANLFGGTWGLLCGDCGFEIQKEMGKVEGG